MIDHIASTGRWIQTQINGGLPHIHGYNTVDHPMLGTIRIVNGSKQIWDGSMWQSFSGSMVHVDLTTEGRVVMEWAREKMLQEIELKRLAAAHPSVADAVAAVESAQEKLQVVINLTKEYK